MDDEGDDTPTSEEDESGWSWMRAGTNPVYAVVLDGRIEAIVYRSEALAAEDEAGEPIIGEAGWFWYSAADPAFHRQLTLGELPDQTETMLIPEHDAALEAAQPHIDQLIGRGD